ncbi:MAG: ABC transporter permease [Syntrophobacteraceae bacterium]
MKFIELRNIDKVYQLGEITMPVLQGISLGISRGEFVALMGASGSGKTTLMNIMGCLDHPTSGEYRLDGRDVTGMSSDEQANLRNQQLGFVFQNFNLLPRTSALENVIMPLSYSSEGLSDREARARAEELLQRVGLGDRLNHEQSQLSGGQQQRVAIARALINRPAILFADEPTGNLDSRTSEEVLGIFHKLNEEGVTIIMVTHDEEVARYAKRIIRIRDGRIDSEHATQAAGEEPATYSDAQQGKKRPALRGLAGSRRMLRTALNGLRRNVLRAALTALGIIIGVAAVITMMEIGRGSSTSIQKAITSMGANILLVHPGTAASGGVTFGAGTVMTLTPDDAEAIRRDCPAIRSVAPTVRARTQVVYGNRNWVPSTIYGTTPSYLEVREWSMMEGDVFSDQDVRNAMKVCVLGQTIVRELFAGELPVGKEVRINNVPFTVVGILNSKGANMMGRDQDDIVLAPWTTIKYRVAGTSLANANQSSSASSSSGSSQQTNTLSKLYPTSQNSLYPELSETQAANTPLPVRFTNVDEIYVAAASTSEIPNAIQQMTDVLRERHRIRPDEPDDFHIRDMTEMTKTLSSTATMMANLLLAVALISLVVGGVGIMNIMLVSVTERTREIGLRMAVGARRGSILQQFLTESVVLCFLGGAFGILFGRGFSLLVRTLLHWPTELSIGAVLAAFAVSATVGIVFGYYPAWKASRLDPITALRYE